MRRYTQFDAEVQILPSIPCGRGRCDAVRYMQWKPRRPAAPTTRTGDHATALDGLTAPCKSIPAIL
jgi:hypothetical protein